MLSGLQHFAIDLLDASYECNRDGSAWQMTTQDSKFCVVEASTATSATAVPTTINVMSTGSSESSYLLYAVIGGSLLVVVLIFFAVRKKYRDPKDMQRISSKDESFESMFDGTQSFDESHVTLISELLNGPIIIMHRIPHDQVRVAACLSQGGFGIVYSNMYQRRRDRSWRRSTTRASLSSSACLGTRCAA